jgi:predicted glycoside hydrolase/deacetylase ChbG (UPF0249 family)
VVIVNPTLQRDGLTTSKFLIIHADDLGMCSSTNRAIFVGMEEKKITSASLMVPCPWFPEVVERTARHSDWDIGVHLTLTSEWDPYKWKPIAPSGKGLTDRLGYFWSASELMAQNAAADVVATEALAQIKYAREAGIRISHVDNHMFSLIRPQFLSTYISVANQCALPLFAASRFLDYPRTSSLLKGNLLVDRSFEIRPNNNVPESQWLEYYISVLDAIEPGISQLVIHPGFDDQELRSVTSTKKEWGSEWRQRDFDVVMSKEFKEGLDKRCIKLTNWTEVSRLTGFTAR